MTEICTSMQETMLVKKIVLKPSTSRLFSDRDLMALFLPLVIEQALKYSLGLVDSVMIASVGEAAISGVSLIDFVMSFITSLFAALLVGGSAVVSQHIGAGEIAKANRTANQLVRLVGVFAILLCGFVYLAKSFILDHLFGELAPDVYEHADVYLSITTSSIPFVALYCVGSNLFRCMDNTKLPMKIMMTCNLLNIAGNAALIYGLKIGTAGIALPTLFSRVIAACWILYLLINRDRKLHLVYRIHKQFDRQIIRQILRIGIPCGVENGTFFLGRILVLGMIASFGTVAIASNAVAGILSNFQLIPGMAISFGTTTVIARCAGANDYDQAKYYNRKILGIVYIAQFITSMIVFMLLPQIMQIYGLSPETTYFTERIILMHTFFTVLLWPLSYILPAVFRASCDARYPMIISVLSFMFCRFFCSWVLGIYWGMGILGIWLAMFLDWVIKAVCFILRYLSGKWMMCSMSPLNRTKSNVKF